jgi:hypothetical protein
VRARTQNRNYFWSWCQPPIVCNISRGQQVVEEDSCRRRPWTARIGQTRQVFAYRLIARDTVEEKVLELQSSKRDLAAAIISQDNSVLRNLKREDLELLLS